MKFKKKPVEIDALQFTGDNWLEINQFVGKIFPHDGDLHWGFTPVEEGEDEVVAIVWDKLHSTWVGVKANQWIIKGVKGEFYPCDADVFEETYDAIDDFSDDDNAVSPYCMSCAPKHRGIPHHFHETSEHNDWWDRYAKLQLNSTEGSIDGL